MSWLIPLSAGHPLAFIALVLLPLIWWLLKVMPPKPDLEIFPPLKTLAKVLKNDNTPHKTPWWLTFLRMLMAAAVILAIADPGFNRAVKLDGATGPLIIVHDNGWPSKRIETIQRATAESLITEAARSERVIYIAATSQANTADTGPFDPDTARKHLASLTSAPVFADRRTVIANLISKLPENANATMAILSDGISNPKDEAAFAALDTSKVAATLWYTPPQTPFAAITSVKNTAEALEIEVARFGKLDEASLIAFDGKSRRIGETKITFNANDTSATGKILAPIELRNDIQSVTIEGQKLSGGTYVLDDNLRRRRVALLSGADGDLAQPLLSPLYYIRKAIEPFADIVTPRNLDLSASLVELIATNPSVIIMADIGAMPEQSVKPLETWIENGGVLLRFAGPRLAATVDDKFLPVILRQGERALGGTMSWTDAQPVAEFPKNSPFAAIPTPKDVTVTRQVLAEPDSSLSDKTWASLTDGTPLVTADKRGRGQIILFHVTPQATWSNLPISGTFVEMLRQTIALASTTGQRNADGSKLSLKPWRIIAADGAIGPAPADAQPLEVSDKMLATNQNPPGLYGNEDGAIALNLLKSGAKLEPATIPILKTKVQTQDYVTAETKLWKGPLLGLAALLLILDCLVMIWTKRQLSSTLKLATALLFISLVPPTLLYPTPGFAQQSDAKPGDQEAVEAISKTRLAYVITSNADIDRVSKEGLEGLTMFLRNKTALEPDDPVGIDPATAELTFYPMLYWPIDPDGTMPSKQALANIDAYMQAGGSVLFDTRDQGSSSFTLNDDTSPATRRLREILDGMNVPPLEPVPSDHVLTKSFFLLKDFVGHYAGSPLWVEQSQDSDLRVDRPVRSGDGVSPILITGNDLASAWALNVDGEPLYPTEPNDPQQRIYALRGGVNIVMYMLTGNYKADQVHIQALLERLGQ